MKLKKLLEELQKFDPEMDLHFTVVGYVVLPLGDWQQHFVQVAVEEGCAITV